MRSFREITQGATLVALMLTTTLYVLPSVLAPADQLDTTNAMAAPYGVSIIWTNDFRNCGHQYGVKIPGHVGGCWNRFAPNVIYVAPSRNSETQRFTIAHEIAHVLQYRNGEAQDECAADSFAFRVAPSWNVETFACALTNSK